MMPANAAQLQRASNAFSRNGVYVPRFRIATMVAWHRRHVVLAHTLTE